jgi:Zn-finger nucleic acid-binding protein
MHASTENGMYCPRCAAERLVSSQRLGIELDSCPYCRGIWLDRGELDKILSRLIEERLPAADATVPAAGEASSRPDWLREVFG